jgi:hypothetical protein
MTIWLASHAAGHGHPRYWTWSGTARWTTFLGRSLSRPCFLDYAQVSRLTRNLDQRRTSLTGLPDRLFAGDIAAFARAAGTTETQAAAVVRGRGETPPRIGRADFFLDEVGFRLMEINWGSAVGGLDSAPEVFPTETGTEEWTLTWGAFMVSRGYGGMFIRGSRDPNTTVNMATGTFASTSPLRTPPDSSTG